MMTSACNSQQITNNNLEYSSCKVTADDNCKYLLFKCIVTGLQDKNQMKDSEQFDEELYTKRLEEGYDIFDEKYVRWLLLHRPDKVPGDWLQKVPTSSKQQVATESYIYQPLVLQHVASYSYLCNYTINNVL